LNSKHNKHQIIKSIVIMTVISLLYQLITKNYLIAVAIFYYLLILALIVRANEIIN